MESLYFSAAAGVLAARLENGLPCPVCGSADHPSPAALPNDVPTEERLQHQKKRRENAAARYTAASQSSGESLAALREKQAALERAAAEMQVSPDAAAMEAALDAVRQKQLLLTADLTSSRKRWERRRALPGLLENLNGQIRTKAAEEQSLATSLSQQQAAAVAARASWETLRSELPASTPTIPTLRLLKKKFGGWRKRRGRPNWRGRMPGWRRRKPTVRASEWMAAGKR